MDIHIDTGLLPADSALRQLKPGDRVYWEDPDCGWSSGHYRITAILADGICYADTVVILKNEAGSEAEVFVTEIKPD